MSDNGQFKIFCIVFLILIKENKILSLRRYNTPWLTGYYSVIAGHLNGGETAQQAIIREAKEEANIDLLPKNLKVAHIMHRIRPTRELVDIYFTADAWGSDIKNMEPEKHDNLDWYDIDKLPDNFLPEVKFALENIKNNIFYSEFEIKAET